MGTDRYNRRISGLSLIELMVALALGVVLSFGAVNLFLQSKRSYLQDEESARLQENGRFAMRYLGRELSMAGYIGGVLYGDQISAIPSGGTDCFKKLTGDGFEVFPVEHYNNPATAASLDPNMPSACWSAEDVFINDPNNPAPDVLLVRRTRDRMTDPNQPGVSIDSNRFYLRVQDSNVSITLVQGGSMAPLTDYWEFTPQILFIRDHSVASADGIPTLCRKRLATGGAKDNGPTECLVEGVENMQIEFGIDSDGDQYADYFVDSPSTAELNSAVMARIYLLLRSVNAIVGYTNDKVYTLGQTEVTAPSDEFYRRVFQTTVLLRNSEAYKF